MLRGLGFGYSSNILWIRGNIWEDNCSKDWETFRWYKDGDCINILYEAQIAYNS